MENRFSIDTKYLEQLLLRSSFESWDQVLATEGPVDPSSVIELIADAYSGDPEGCDITLAPTANQICEYIGMIYDLVPFDQKAFKIRNNGDGRIQSLPVAQVRGALAHLLNSLARLEQDQQYLELQNLDLSSEQ